jgi:hypothetical protein
MRETIEVVAHITANNDLAVAALVRRKSFPVAVHRLSQQMRLASACKKC